MAAQVRVSPAPGRFLQGAGLLLVREVARIGGRLARRAGPSLGAGMVDGGEESYCRRWRVRPRAGRTRRSRQTIWGQERVDCRVLHRRLDAVAGQAAAEDSEGDPEAIPRAGDRSV